MQYNIDEIEYVKAVKISGEKTDVQVQVTVKLKEAIDVENLQVKRGQIYNLRPCTWYSNKLKYPPFNNKDEFLTAISKTHEQYSQCKQYSNNWLINVRKKYLESTGLTL